MATTHQLEVDLRSDGSPILLAGRTLCRFDDSDLYFSKRGYRHPLGIYNVSISRIVDRANKFATELHSFFSRTKTLKDSHADGAMAAIEDKLEMLVYAIAEHVDDCETILKTFFKTDHEFSKSRSVRRFKDAMKLVRRDTSVLANAIKHNHQRVRFFDSEFFFVGEEIVLLGFFLEKFVDGGLRPDPNFLGPGKKVASCVGFLWSSILNIVRSSRALEEALLDLKAPATTDIHPWNDVEFRKLVGLISGLPLYVFDDENPFQSLSLKLVGADASVKRNAQIASFYRPVTEFQPLGAGSFSLRYAGDGVTKTFDFAAPTRAVFPHVESGTEP